MKPRSPASFLLIFCSMIVGATVLSGCGQRGPLRLPVIPLALAAPPAAAKPATNTLPPAVESTSK